MENGQKLTLIGTGTVAHAGSDDEVAQKYYVGGDETNYSVYFLNRKYLSSWFLTLLWQLVSEFSTLQVILSFPLHISRIESSNSKHLLHILTKKFFHFAAASSTRGHCYKCLSNRLVATAVLTCLQVGLFLSGTVCLAILLTFPRCQNSKRVCFQLICLSFQSINSISYLSIRTVVSVLREPYCPCLPIAFHLLYLLLFVILAVLNK